ncbi:stage V sporulation protein AA [Peribacillus frigoritolerans]|nr:stage V sporulation protein AA [Peribacillus frigoritolerans]
MAVVYIRMRNRVQAKGNQTVRIKDIARIIGPEEVITKIEEIILLTVKKEDKNIIVIDLAQVIMAIRKVDPTIEVETFGPSQTIIEIILSKKENVIPDIRLSLVFCYLSAAG